MNSLIHRYQVLLDSEETLESTRNCLAVADEVLAQRVMPHLTKAGFAQLFDKVHSDLASTLDQAYSRVLGDAARGQPNQARALAHRAGSHLGIRSVWLHDLAGSVSDQAYSFYFDACNLLFHHTYQAVVPLLNDRRLRADRDRLVAAGRSFARVQADPADMYIINARCSEAEGDLTSSANSFRAAVQATHSDDEVYLTRVQMCCTALMGQDRYKEAILFLLDEIGRVTQQDMDEFRELFVWVTDVGRKSVPLKRAKR